MNLQIYEVDFMEVLKCTSDIQLKLNELSIIFLN